MPGPPPRLVALHRSLPLKTEFCLTATAFFLWCLAGSLQVQIGVAVEGFRLVVGSPHWQLQWPAWPWLLAVSGLALAYGRHRWGKPTPEQTLRLSQNLRQLSLLTGSILLLRLCTLWSPFTILFPYLTLLWSPHATWALGAAIFFYPQTGTLPLVSNRRLALVLFMASAFILALWALYFCQMAMLHGDEAHYLRVTQSLLHDGDMDLTNNLGPEQALEYHIVDFQPHKAPSSPPGKIHSVHPIGLSALLLPTYWTGLKLWHNPRLACSLGIALLSAGVLTLALLWLVRLGFNQWHALACTLIGASTTPFFLYTVQLYPEIPALLIALLCLLLLTSWQSPTPGYRSLGAREPHLLAGLTLLLIGLLFLHPRYLPLAAFLGGGIGLQVWHSPQRRQLLRWCLPLGGAGALALVAFNFAYSNDPLGPFMPGNAWGAGALQGTTLLFSLPGQWLHNTTGLLNSSPVFLTSLLGLALLAIRRDRRGWGVLAFYLATAGVNGLHPDWTFGFCPPARYLLTALPVLLFGLALFIQTFASRLLPLFGLLLALMLSYDSVACVLAIPEHGFGGHHLEVRTLEEFYPFGVHFFSETTGPLPWPDLCFWTVVTAGLTLALLPQLSRSWRWACLLTVGLLPFAWSQTNALTARLSLSISPYLRHLNPAGEIPAGVEIFNGNIEKEYQTTTGQRLKTGGFGAQSPQNPAGVLKAYYAQLIQPGASSYWLTGASAENAPGQVAGHLVIGQRQTLPAIADWGIFYASPIALPGKPASAAKTTFYSDFTGLGYVFVEFSGAGALAFTKAQSRFQPAHFRARWTEVRRFPSKSETDASRLGVHCEQLEAGYYLARFELQGAATGTFFERKPNPVYLAVYAEENSPPGAPPLETQANHWLEGYYPMQDPTPRPEYIHPMVERIQAPWWTAMPLVGASAYELTFALHQAQEIWLLFDYPGNAGLKLAGITLYRQELSTVGLTD